MKRLDIVLKRAWVGNAQVSSNYEGISYDVKTAGARCTCSIEGATTMKKLHTVLQRTVDNGPFKLLDFRENYEDIRYRIERYSALGYFLGTWSYNNEAIEYTIETPTLPKIPRRGLSRPQR
jgi:hypothetical protein